MTTRYDNGPFGYYDAASCDTGRIRNLLVMHEKLPVNQVYQYEIGDKFITYKGQPIAEYRWFSDGMAYFRWLWHSANLTWKSQAMQRMRKEVRDSKIKSMPDFRATLSSHNQPSLEFFQVSATPHLHNFLQLMLTNSMTLKAYELHKAAGAFFQSGSHDPNCDYFMLEFWQPEGVQAFIDHINQNYDPDMGIVDLIAKYCKENTVVLN